MNTVTFPHVSSPEGHHVFAKAASTVAFGWVKSLAAFVENEMAVRTAIRDLRLMDDRTLADIGICRAEIKDAARGRLLAK